MIDQFNQFREIRVLLKKNLFLITLEFSIEALSNDIQVIFLSETYSIVTVFDKQRQDN